jgi:LSD1 subclass zinc finger protein
MPVEAIVCSQCGAPLEVPAGVGFVTCNHCHAQLAVRREASVTYTEAIQKLASQTERLSDHVAQLRYESELERIDREWRLQREGLLVSDRRGNQTRPNSAAAGVMMFIGVVGGGVMSVFFYGVASLFGARSGEGPPGLLILFPFAPLLFALFAVIAGYSTMLKANDYKRAEAEYERRRAAVRLEDFQTPPE